MELFVPKMVFNPDLRGKVIHVTGYDEYGDKVNFTGFVSDVESNCIRIYDGELSFTVYDNMIGENGVTLAVAGGFKPLRDNREPEGCDVCGNHPDHMPNCEGCGGTGKGPKYDHTYADEQARAKAKK